MGRVIIVAARSLGRREVRRQHPRRAARRGDLDGEAGPPAPDGRHRGDDCDSRRNLVAGAAAGRRAATGLGDVGRPVVPAGLPGRAHRVTVFPFPRTAFTLASGLLFGPWLGISIAVVASTSARCLALLLVRAAGWRLDRLVPHPRVKALDARLRQRGWPTVMSMRLIPAVPFSVLNYAAGASAVRVLPYTWATLAGCCRAPPRSSSSATRSPTTSARC